MVGSRHGRVALAYAGPLIAPEPWELLLLMVHSKASVHLLVEHPRLDELSDRLATEPRRQERVRLIREGLGPWRYEYIPAVSIGVTHSIVGVGPKVGAWPLIPGHMGLHNWEYVTHPGSQSVDVQRGRHAVSRHEKETL